MKVRLCDKWVVISLWKLSLSLVSQGIIKLRRTWWDIYRSRQMVWDRTHLYCLWRILCSVWQGAMQAVLILAARTLKNADIVNNVCCWGPLLFLCSLLQSSMYSLRDKRGRKPAEKKRKEPQIPSPCPPRKAQGQIPWLYKCGRACRNQCIF